MASSDVYTSSWAKASLMDLACEWKDQGWGNVKGQLRIRLVDIASGDTIDASYYAYAPRPWAWLNDEFVLEHPLLKDSTHGYKFVLDVLAGSHGGHVIYVRNFSLSARPLSEVPESPSATPTAYPTVVPSAQ